MKPSFFQNSAWYNALTLKERIASLRAQSTRTIDTNTDINKNLARQRLQKWKSQSPFTEEFYFAQRLAMDRVNKDEFLQLLGEPIEMVQYRCPNAPHWFLKLAKAFSNSVKSTTHTTFSAEELGKTQESSFLSAINPLISQAIERLNKEIKTVTQTQSYLPFNTSTICSLLLTNLQKQLLKIMSRTMILELNVARLQGLLAGQTPEERFENFLERVQQREVIIAILQEYPVIARQLVITVDNWLDYSLEFIQHLCQDWDVICNTFSPETDPGILVEIKGDKGDTHRGGRAVLIAGFSSGFQIVYKPRALNVDVHFQQLLDWLNQHGNHPPFHTLKIINRDNYGWVEFVAVKTCTTKEEVQRFYERQGAYLALLYALEATDFHNENLIAVGEHPILIDLESLFHPRPEKLDFNQSKNTAIDTLSHSVLRIGLLPQRIMANAEYDGIEISGLGGKHDQLTPFPVQYVEEQGTDKMRIGYQRKHLSGSHNLPTLNNSQIDVLDYTEQIIKGFTSIYKLLIDYQDKLLSNNSPLADFASDEVRFILRPTNTYGVMLDESFHPDLLRNALDRDRFFDRLWFETKYSPYLTKVIFAERDDLWRGDIPIFITRPNSRDLWTSSHQKISNFFDQTGMSLVKNRLQQLSDDDLQEQVWFIRASLTTLAMIGKQGKWPRYHLKESRNIVSQEQLLKAALAIGDRLEELALSGEQDVTWIGLTLLNQKHWTLVPLDTELYNGLSGIILFLAYLGKITKQEHYTSLAKSAFISLQRKIEDSKTSLKLIGAFEGWGGIIYTLTHLGILWNDLKLLDEAESLVEILPNLIKKDDKLDIISGSAGCIASLLGLYRYRPSESILNVAIQCGERIIYHTQATDDWIGWLSNNGEEQPLSGFSHGAAGIALTLFELALVTGESRFRTAAMAAIEYERGLFVTEVGNWIDFRHTFGTSNLNYISGSEDLSTYFPGAIMFDSKNMQHLCMTTWCHGAPGIGLARLRCLTYLNDANDAEIYSEINTALETTLAHGFGSNHSLCHGDLGNLELLLQASQTLDNPEWKMQVDRLSTIILESINKHGWLCGVPLGVETPGLMTGLAGIGYQLLRLAEPERVPSVLVLEPPKINSTKS